MDQRHLERIITQLYESEDDRAWDRFIDMLDQAVWERRYSGRSLMSIDIEGMIRSALDDDHSDEPVRESASNRSEEDLDCCLRLVDEITSNLVREEVW